MLSPVIGRIAGLPKTPLYPQYSGPWRKELFSPPCGPNSLFSLVSQVLHRTHDLRDTSDIAIGETVGAQEDYGSLIKPFSSMYSWYRGAKTPLTIKMTITAIAAILPIKMIKAIMRTSLNLDFSETPPTRVSVGGTVGEIYGFIPLPNPRMALDPEQHAGSRVPALGGSFFKGK